MYRFEARYVGRSQGKSSTKAAAHNTGKRTSAVAAAAYLARAEITDERLPARYQHGCIWLTQQRGGTVNCRSGDYAAAMVAGERQFHGSSAFRSRLLVRPETIRCRTSVR